MLPGRRSIREVIRTRCRGNRQHTSAHSSIDFGASMYTRYWRTFLREWRIILYHGAHLPLTWSYARLCPVGGIKPASEFIETYSFTVFDKLGKVPSDDLLFVFRLSNQFLQPSKLHVVFIIGDRNPRWGYNQKTSCHSRATKRLGANHVNEKNPTPAPGISWIVLGQGERSRNRYHLVDCQ